MFSSLICLLIINSIEVGAHFGPTSPTGSLANNYRLTTIGSLFGQVNNLELDYSYSKFNGKINNRDFLFLHIIGFSYQYPFLQMTNSQFTAVLGGNYNRVIRKLVSAHEASYVLGLKYGLGFNKNFTVSEHLRPTLLSRLCLNQIIQARSWNSNQLLSSNLFISLTVGLSFRFHEK
jgi:hypothetical protein